MHVVNVTVEMSRGSADQHYSKAGQVLGRQRDCTNAMIRRRTGVQKQASARTVCKCRPFGLQITTWHHSFTVIASEGLYLIKISLCLLEFQLDRTEVSLFNSCFFWGKVLLCCLAGALVLHQACSPERSTTMSSGLHAKQESLVSITRPDGMVLTPL